MSNRRRRQRGSRLFALYVLASLIPIAVIGAVAMRGDSNTGMEFSQDWGRAQSAVIEQMSIAPALGTGDLSLGLSDAQRQRLQSATDLAIFNGTVAHLRLRAFTGAVEFSDNGSTTGSVPVSDPSFRVAAAGGTDVRVIAGNAHTPGVVRVLQPVIAAANGQATGVLEVYLPYDAIATKVAANTHDEITRLAFSLLGLFGLLALISWWTTRALRHNAATHEYWSLHDSLTGLPNRELFRQTAEDAIEHGPHAEHGALVLIDLDHFKEVNDTLGHHAGDELLKVVSRRLCESLRTDDMVARLGGDEFAMVLPHLRDRHETLSLLSRIRAELAAVVVLDGVSLSVQASFGVCFYPGSAETAEGLLQHADAAMYLGKAGHGGIVIYDAAMAHRATHTLAVQVELRGALDRDELVLHYQPKMRLSSGAVICLEALVAWQHPQRGLLPSSQFLSVAEGCDLLEPLMSWVLERALADYRAWTAAGHDWAVAVNVSERNLSSAQFPASVRQILSEAGVPPHRLHLEVSQTAMALDVELAEMVISPLSDQGIVIAMDHFGMDLSDLALFSTANVSEIKMDQTLLADLPGNAHDRSIVASVVAVGHDLGCTVTAQGVESQDVADALAEAGCDFAQGYLWLHPGPWTEVARAFGGTTYASAVTPAAATAAGLPSGSRGASP